MTQIGCLSRSRRGRSSLAASRSISSRALRSASRPAIASSSKAGCCSMIDGLVGYALTKRLVVAMICVFVGIYGYYSWTELAIEAYPDIADITSQVVTQAPGLAAEEIEQQITI